MVRLPKPDGDTRLIVFSHSMIRLWGKLRRPVSAERQASYQCDQMWGTRAGHTSSDSAFDRNIQQEGAWLLGEHACTILLGMSKCY
eukprot:434455-Pyramimonas_sp.AAC.1